MQSNNYVYLGWESKQSREKTAPKRTLLGQSKKERHTQRERQKEIQVKKER